MSLTNKDRKKLESIARVLGSAMADLQELAEKYDGQPPASRKRRNLKSQRIDECRYIIEKSRRS